MAAQFNQLIIVGETGGTSVGESLARAGRVIGHNVTHLDARESYSAPVWVRRIFWHAFDRRPPKLHSFQRHIRLATTASSEGIVITTGLAPVTRSTLLAAKARGFL